MAAEPPLLGALKAEIAAHGPMPVYAFMARALGDPEHGYYRGRARVGAEGDFLTAPEASQIFGELLGLWAAATWTDMGQPTPFWLVELGPGRGTLMADALRAARLAPEFREAVRLALVESDPSLRASQADALGPSGIAPMWFGEAASLPPGPAIIIANEFIDALPVRQFVRLEETWGERAIAVDAAGRLAFTTLALSGLPPRLPPVAASASPGDIIEVRPDAVELLNALAETRGGAALQAVLIDYGYARPALGDTLQALYRHQRVDPLTTPGLADLTTHVDFASLAEAGLRAGLVPHGPLTQAEFLGALGFEARLGALLRAARSPEQAAMLEAGAQRLIHPNAMGALFKVMAFSSPGLNPPPPWRARA